MRKQPASKNNPNGRVVAAILRMIPLVELAPAPGNPRKEFNEDSLNDLADSIRRHGVLQPILAREVAMPKVGKKKYQIICSSQLEQSAVQEG
ncbi:MAG: ParB N-terminal domain-containing protein [Blastocatellia bacterium]